MVAAFALFVKGYAVVWSATIAIIANGIMDHNNRDVNEDKEHGGTMVSLVPVGGKMVSLVPVQRAVLALRDSAADGQTHGWPWLLADTLMGSPTKR